MAEQSFPFDSEIVNGAPDRAYMAEIFRKYFKAFIGNGIFPNPSEQLQVLARSPEVMQVEVKVGTAFTEGAFYDNDEDLILAISDADPVLNRIDAIVVQCDYLQRQVTCKVIKGEPATEPVHYTPIRNADYFELLLAEVYVPFAAISIKQSNITDYRLNNDVCGIVTGVVDQVDTTTLFNQYFAKWQEVQDWISQNEATYDAWYLAFTTNAENRFEEQINAQKTTFEGFEAAFNAWFTQAQAQIFDAKYFDFDNNIYRKGFEYSYTQTENPTVYTETITNSTDGSVYATRTNTANEDETQWTIHTVCEELIVDTTEVWTQQEDETWKGVFN